MELISREEALEAIRAIKEVMLTNGEVINALYHVPTIENRPKGKWIGDKCSNCGHIDILQPYAWVEQNGEMIQVLAKNFCSNCGAYMRGE